MEPATELNLKEMFPVSSRKVHLAACSGITAALGIVFGVLNILGSRNIHRDRVKFDQRKDCSEGICTKEVALNYPGAANIYLQYSFFETSYFIFAKGQNYADIFKKKAYLSDNAGCYPIETFGDEDRLREFLNLPRLDPKEVDFAARRVPCGLKAALFRFIGKLNVYELTSDNDEPSEIALNRQDLVDKAYLDAAKVYSLTEDPLPTNGEFLSWYLPQVPGRGTKVLVAKADNGLQGNIRFVFDKTQVFYDSTECPTIEIQGQGTGISKFFNNLIFGIVLATVGVAALLALPIYTYLQARNSK